VSGQLAGKTAIVTGAASGIGLATVAAMVARAKERFGRIETLTLDARNAVLRVNLTGTFLCRASCRA
jgi:NADP-dependent 3-hydroxy acid dehydrogenase YdfG